MNLEEKQKKIDNLISMLKDYGLPYPKTCGALHRTEEAADRTIDDCYKTIARFTCND